jgi:tetratricopeptide (TPR) repeat protein
MHYYQGDYDKAQEWCDRGWALFRDLPDEYGMAAAERWMGRVAQAQGDLESAERHYREGLQKARKFKMYDSDFNQQGELLSSLAGLAEARGQWREAREGYSEALKLYQEKTRNQKGIVAMLHRLGSVALAEDKYEEAERLLSESLSLLKGKHLVSREAKTIYTLALLQEKRGLLPQAQELLTQARQKFQSLSAAADLARADAALTRVEAMLTYQQRQKQQS